MIIGFDTLLESIPANVNLYYILPFIFALIVFRVQWKKNNTNLISVGLLTFEIFSMTTSFEYFSIFLYTESLPKSIALLDKFILFVGTLIAFLIILLHTTEGSWIGNRINDILNKYLLSKPMLMSISPFAEQLIVLKSVVKDINIGDEDRITTSFNIFLENGSSIVTSLTKSEYLDDNEVSQIKTLFTDCKKNFETMCGCKPLDPNHRVKTAGSVSEFIGSVDGFTKQLEWT